MIKFAGLFLPHYVKVKSINYSVLGEIEHKTAKIQGRRGVYDFGTEHDQKQIEVEYQIIADSNADIIRKVQEFASWLIYDELKPLEILDTPDRYYMARVVGSTEVGENHRIGEGKITFAIPDGIALSKTEKDLSFTIVNETPVAITNEGTVETYPVIRLTMKKDAENIGIVTDDRFFQVGDYIDETKTSLPAKTTVLKDNCQSFTGWASGIGVDGGTITGTFASDGETLYQASKNYGSGSSWHGAAATKSLSKQVKNFAIETRMLYDETAISQVGRVEVYLFDVNNVNIGKFALVNNSSTSINTFGEARAGSMAEGTYFVQNRARGKYIAKMMGRYQQAYFGDKEWCYMSLSRVNNKWTFYFADLLEKTGTTKHYMPWSASYTDKTGKYGANLAKIQIHISSYSSKTPINRMAFTDLKVVEINSVTAANNIIDLEKDDVIEIDNERGIVTKNGKVYFEGMNPASRFFTLEPGVTGISVTPPIADMTIRYRERYL